MNDEAKVRQAAREHGYKVQVGCQLLHGRKAHRWNILIEKDGETVFVGWDTCQEPDQAWWKAKMALRGAGVPV